MSERESERSVSQTVRAQLALRDMILSGRLRAAERISELQAVEITGVSRTPVRLALVRLEDEGLLQAIPSGGFMVKAFSERDILDSIELRGTLEGLAARLAAERGASARSLEPLKECLGDLDRLVRQDPVSVEAFSAYVTLNARFHALLTDLCGIENREGARAEAIMREHARLAVRNLRLALRNRSHLDLLPALALVTSATD
jgi:GntR family transcriptional regulator of vanillate catabolism